MALRKKTTPAPAPQRSSLVRNEKEASETSGSSSPKLGDTPDKTDVFNLMVVRSTKAVEPSVLQANYIHDRHPRSDGEMVSWLDVDIQQPASECVVGHIVYEAVFCGPAPDADITVDYQYQQFVIAILALLTPYYPPCDNVPPPPAPGNLPPVPLQVADLERHANISYNGFWYLLLDQIDLIAGFPAVRQVRATQRAFVAAATGRCRPSTSTRLAAHSRQSGRLAISPPQSSSTAIMRLPIPRVAAASSTRCTFCTFCAVRWIATSMI